MKHNFLSLTLIALLLTSLPAAANNLTVKMDKTSPTMTMVSKATGASVTTGDPTNNIYTFECKIEANQAGAYKTCVRMFPKNDLLPHRQDFCYIKWLD